MAKIKLPAWGAFWYDNGMNVYIVGVPTAGKSTLTKIIKERYPRFNVVSFEAVRNGFMKAQPGLDMGNRQSLARKEILPQFLIEFAEWNEKMTGQPTLVEGSFASVEEVVDLVRKEDVVICLGYGGIALEEVARQAIRMAGPESYLYGRTEAEFVEHFYDLAEDDQVNKKFCDEKQIPYFVTAGEREKVLEKATQLVLSCLQS